MGKCAHPGQGPFSAINLVLLTYLSPPTATGKRRPLSAGVGNLSNCATRGLGENERISNFIQGFHLVFLSTGTDVDIVLARCVPEFLLIVQDAAVKHLCITIYLFIRIFPNCLRGISYKCNYNLKYDFKTQFSR